MEMKFDMNKNTLEQSNENDDMRPEYDFSGGVRGKHYKAYHEGHTVMIHKRDGTTIVQNFKLEEGTVALEPDVREYFPDSESVNNALRSLIALIPQRHKTSSKIRRHAKREGQPVVSSHSQSTS